MLTKFMSTGTKKIIPWHHKHLISSIICKMPQTIIVHCLLGKASHNSEKAKVVQTSLAFWELLCWSHLISGKVRQLYNNKPIRLEHSLNWLNWLNWLSSFSIIKKIGDKKIVTIDYLESYDNNLKHFADH